MVSAYLPQLNISVASVRDINLLSAQVQDQGVDGGGGQTLWPVTLLLNVTTGSSTPLALPADVQSALAMAQPASSSTSRRRALLIARWSGDPDPDPDVGLDPGWSGTLDPCSMLGLLGTLGSSSGSSGGSSSSRSNMQTGSCSATPGSGSSSSSGNSCSDSPSYLPPTSGSWAGGHGPRERGQYERVDHLLVSGGDHRPHLHVSRLLLLSGVGLPLPAMQLVEQQLERVGRALQWLCAETLQPAAARSPVAQAGHRKVLQATSSATCVASTTPQQVNISSLNTSSLGLTGVGAGRGWRVGPGLGLTGVGWGGGHFFSLFEAFCRFGQKPTP